MFFRSVRFKFLLGYLVLLTLTLFAFSLILYGSFGRILYNNLDDLLVARAEGIANSIVSYKQAGTAAADLSLAARDWLEEKHNDPELMSISARILDEKGRDVSSPKTMPHLKPLDNDVLEDALDGEDDFDTAAGVSAEGKKIKYRIYTKPVYVNNAVAYIVQAAGPVTLLSLALNKFLVILLVLLPLTIILACSPGVLLAKVTLKPVDNMIDTLRQITAENLKLKIHMPDTKDEIKRLADTFNEMIDRIDRSFTSQQRFIQDISQELKAPICAIQKEFDEALAKGLPEPVSRALIERASKEMGEIAVTIENFMTLSEFAASRDVFEIRKVDLGHVIHEVVDDMRTLALKKDIEVSFSGQENIVIDGDAARLRRLFANLLDNAIKFTYRKGKVTVTMRTDGSNAVVYVSDTGIGIPDDEQSYIFDRFYQVSRSRGVDRGFGLGLSGAKSIVEAHKGSMYVESQEGKGSNFIVTLPVSYPG